MKRILFILAATLALYSCATKRPEITPLETGISAGRAWDSFNLQLNTFYRVVLTRGFNIDSSIGIRFTANNSLTEYKVKRDTFGLHLEDSTAYSLGTSYSEYQFADPNYYASSVGYVLTRFNPTAGTGNTFPLHDLMIFDTFFLRIGTPISIHKVGGTLKGIDSTIPVTIYR